MARFRVMIARDRSEYAEVVVEAANARAAEALVERVYVDGVVNEGDEAALLDGPAWNDGGDPGNERVVDVFADDDSEATATETPEALETCPRCGVTAPAGLPCPGGCGAEADETPDTSVERAR